MKSKFTIHPDVKKAETLPAAFYRDVEVFDELKEKIFARSWQWLGDEALLPLPESAHPFVFMESFLPEAMILVRDGGGRLRCMSNVCTHRGNLLVQNPGKFRQLHCMYHGRKFDLDGKFLSMPEFKEADNFPRDCEDLHSFPIGKWGPLLFTSLEPAFDFSEITSMLDARLSFLPLNELRFRADLSKDYLVNCHWALYCDNYLEGFHIPFVHRDLNKVLDYGSYASELYKHATLQIGYSAGGDDVFDLPKGHVNAAKSVAAYYYWIFPNTMLNFYPWGLSVNVVKPQGMNRTRVSFLSYVLDESKIHSGAGAALDKVEREVEFVVEGVAKGLQSRYYKSGRFSPTMEKGVHHFHRLLAEYLND